MRTSRSTKRLNDIIHKENSPLGKLFRKSEFLQKLNNEIDSFLPKNLSSQCQVANINRTELVLHVRSAALLTRLRLIQKPLLNQINQRYAWANIEKISVKVRPIRKQTESHPKAELSRSQFIADTIEETASHCHDKDLKIALLNLASHIQKPID
jgi:hypothetical protein